MKLYKKRIMKLVTAILVIAIVFNAVLTNKYNVVTATQTEDIVISEHGTFHKEKIDGTMYYVQRFSITSEIGNYNISINNFPNDTKILDINNNEITSTEEEIFKVAIPQKNIKEDLKGIVIVNNVEYEFSKKANVSTITTKVIYKNGLPKANTTIELKIGEELLSTTVTNEEGIIEFTDLYPAMYSIYEKDIEGNIVGNHPIVLELLYNEKVTINVFNEISNGSNIIVENEKKKGTVEIYLINGDYENEYLNNCEVEIYDSENNLIETLITDEKGLATSSRLPIDNIYKVKQKNTWEDYIVDLGMHKIEFEEDNQVIILEITNYIKKNFIKITKVDKDNNDIKLEGVVFGIYNANDELIEEITTDRNGEAVSTNLPINNPYYIKEIKTLDNYVLDNKTITVFLTEGTNSTGEISIDRLSSINNFLIIENQKIYNILPKFGA